jgi:hypothetical protein
MYGQDGEFLLDSCIIEDNLASVYDGGGLRISNSISIITNCLFSRNAVAGRSANGGGLSHNGTLKLSNCTLTDNVRGEFGYAGAASISEALR